LGPPLRERRLEIKVGKVFASKKAEKAGKVCVHRTDNRGRNDNDSQVHPP
jgi:hypothetical protein